MATTEEHKDVVDLTRPGGGVEDSDSGGDDIIVVPGGGDAAGRGRGRWLWIGAVAAIAIAVVVVLVATLGSSGSNSNATVKTAGSPAIAPVVTQAPASHDAAPPAAKHTTDTTVAAVSHTPATAVTHTTTAPVHNKPVSPPANDTPPGNNTPPATAPPQPLGPSALTWTAPTSFSISKDGNVLTVTVHNGTNRPAYTNTPLSCLQYGANLCTQNTQTLQPGATVTEHYTLDASQFTSTPTAVYVGGYYKVMISV